MNTLFKIECDREEIRKCISYLKIGLPKRTFDRNEARLEIFFLPKEIRFALIGTVYKLPIATGLYQKVILPYRLFERITLIYPHKRFIVYLDEGAIMFDDKIIKREDIMLIPPECQHSLELSMNHSDADLILLEYIYPEEELEKMRLTLKINEAKDNLESAIGNAADILNQYGVTYDDVLTLTMSKIFKKKFCY